jgi:hypothetical protein
MFYACVTKFDVTGNLEKILVFGTRPKLNQTSVKFFTSPFHGRSSWVIGGFKTCLTKIKRVFSFLFILKNFEFWSIILYNRTKHRVKLLAKGDYSSFWILASRW